MMEVHFNLVLVVVVFPQWQGETQEFCPNAKVVLVGCKLDMRTDVNTLRELSKQRLIPVTHEQVRTTDIGEEKRRGFQEKNGKFPTMDVGVRRLQRAPMIMHNISHLGSAVTLPT